MKRQMVAKMLEACTRGLEAETGIPKSNLSRWVQQKDKLLSFDGNMKRFNLDGAGRPEEIPDTTALTAFMLKLREQPTKAKRLQGDLDELRKAFALDFHTVFAGFEADTIFNVDETGMSYDMPPKTIWAVRGGSSKISSGEKHSYRMTAVLSVRADGAKLPILFIMRGMPGGLIEKNEFDDFPIGHHYAVQECAWMDARVWAYYLRSLLKPQVHAPSVLLLDSFDSHVSDRGVRIATEEVGCLAAPIPPNATSAVQPLDVGIMAPFKRHLRDLWLEEELIQGDDEEEDVDMMTVTAQRKRLAMVQRGIKAWARITPQEIRRSFAKAIPQ
ncbi:hypothetical protein DYB26_012614 [Aphanomyces astaci]|uniref:DDE-1 domain-containing protein n=3 Tax=Aphanomyces astaci TaxID=112090 RepID=A0A397EJZ1_APHAT|nr:hypothetical protein DYB31_014839 [Aphanomyces astaci]RHZ05304.1 hypothetical protein DYB26_012614 [Aphanomyces astaci]